MPSSTTLRNFSSPSYLYLVQDCEDPHFTSLLALATAHIGICNHDARLMDQARLLYGIALQRLWQELPLTNDGNKDNMVIAINILAECEELQITNSGSHGILTHIEGARKFFLHWYESGGSRASELLYFTTLLKLACTNLFSRTPVNFQPPLWILQNAKDRDYFHQLLLIVAQLPGLLHSLDHLSAEESLTSNGSQSIFEAGFALELSLQKWYNNLVFQSCGQPYQSTHIASMTGFDNMGLPTTFETAFSFSSYRQASMLTIYWVAVMVLKWNLADFLERRNTETSAPSGPQQVGIDYHTQARRAALDACQALPFFWEKQECGFLGRIAAVRILRFVQPYFAVAGLDSQFTWCAEILRHLHAAGIVTETERIY